MAIKLGQKQRYLLPESPDKTDDNDVVIEIDNSSSSSATSSPITLDATKTKLQFEQM